MNEPKIDGYRVINVGEKLFGKPKPFGLDDFKVICDERNNPPELLAKENFNVMIQTKRVHTEITFDRDGKIVAINGVDVKDRLYAI